MKRRKIQWIYYFTCDVLIFDDIGANWMHLCIPESVTCRHLSTRFHFPIIIGYKFFAYLLRSLLSPSSWKVCDLYRNYLNILLDTIQPRVVLTGADNNSTLAKIAANRTDILFIFVQTALRDINSFSNIRRLPVYCSFGDIEQNIFSDLNINCDAYLPLGSIKYGIANDKRESHSYRFVDIVFISSYRADYNLNGNNSKLVSRIHELDQLLFQYTINYAVKNKKSVRVLAKSREEVWQHKEYSFYKDLSKGHFFEYICGDKFEKEFSSYYALAPSTLIIHSCSTLGFEALASGARVLFGASSDPSLIRLWGVTNYFQQLPELVCLENNSLEHFSTKLDTIAGLTTDQYRAATETSSRKIMRHCSSKFPHQEIRELLTKLFTANMTNHDLYARISAKNKGQ